MNERLARVCPRIGPLQKVVWNRLVNEAGHKSTANLFNPKKKKKSANESQLFGISWRTGERYKSR